MKKGIVIILVVILILAVLFVPIKKVYDDGGTVSYDAIMYKHVNWNRITGYGTYSFSKTYIFPKSLKSTDELWEEEASEFVHTIDAQVTELYANYANAVPLEYEENLTKEFTFTLTDVMKDENIEIGDYVRITYKGDILYTTPALIDAVSWEEFTPTRLMNYEGTFLDENTREKVEGETFGEDIVIQEIYKDCFFATNVYPFPYEYKINGILPSEYCVGDQIFCRWENEYTDQYSNIEGDLIDVEASTLTLDQNVCYKPVIYLYPEEDTHVTVKLNLDGKLTCTYPRYNGVWDVTAKKDGTLIDNDGKEYSYLYWEGETNTEWDFSKGFCIKGEDTSEFLEYALDKLGLTRKEANEFIVYWLPLMEKNEYNIISFQGCNYTDNAELVISPTPNTVIRVFMAYKASNEYIEIEEQNLIYKERTGFTVVEWGGTEVK